MYVCVHPFHYKMPVTGQHCVVMCATIAMQQLCAVVCVCVCVACNLVSEGWCVYVENARGLCILYTPVAI